MRGRVLGRRRYGGGLAGGRGAPVRESGVRVPVRFLTGFGVLVAERRCFAERDADPLRVGVPHGRADAVEDDLGWEVAGIVIAGGRRLAYVDRLAWRRRWR